MSSNKQNLGALSNGIARIFASCRVFGAISIVTGLYLVIWGKCKDQISPSKSTNVDETDPIDEQLPDKNLTTKSSNDEKNDATKGDIAGGDNAV